MLNFDGIAIDKIIYRRMHGMFVLCQDGIEFGSVGQASQWAKDNRTAILNQFEITETTYSNPGIVNEQTFTLKK
jgi:hypothetical protein